MTKAEQIQDILNNFDFEIVHTLMSKPLYPEFWDEDRPKKTPWKIFLNDGFKVPNNSELKDLALDLLKRLENTSDKKYTYIQAGPFKASNVMGVLKLEFIVTSWNAQ